MDIHGRPGIDRQVGCRVNALRKGYAMTQKNVVSINEIKRPELDAKLVAH